MSARTYMLAIQSLENIKNVVNSSDEKILLQLSEKAGDDSEEFEYVKDMIMGPERSEEPGCWHYGIELLAESLNLSPKSLPLDDWKQYYVWEEYREIADPLVPEESRKLLGYLEVGRPFQGTRIDHDGCMFAWLTSAEVKTLHGELSSLDAEQFDDMDGFHEEFLEALEETVNQNADLFLGAQ